MNFFEAIGSAFLRYFDFQGRSRRSEYWWFVLFNLLLGIATSLFDIGVLNADPQGILPVNTAATLITFIPGLAVSVRRLHDIGRSGWWIFLVFTVVGIIPLIYWACQPGTPGPNEHGPATA